MKVFLTRWRTNMPNLYTFEELRQRKSTKLDHKNNVGNLVIPGKNMNSLRWNPLLSCIISLSPRYGKNRIFIIYSTLWLNRHGYPWTRKRLKGLTIVSTFMVGEVWPRILILRRYLAITLFTTPVREKKRCLGLI